RAGTWICARFDRHARLGRDCGSYQSVSARPKKPRLSLEEKSDCLVFRRARVHRDGSRMGKRTGGGAMRIQDREEQTFNIQRSTFNVQRGSVLNVERWKLSVNVFRNGWWLWQSRRDLHLIPSLKKIRHRRIQRATSPS